MRDPSKMDQLLHHLETENKQLREREKQYAWLLSAMHRGLAFTEDVGRVEDIEALRNTLTKARQGDLKGAREELTASRLRVLPAGALDGWEEAAVPAAEKTTPPSRVQVGYAASLAMSRGLLQEWVIALQDSKGPPMWSQTLVEDTQRFLRDCMLLGVPAAMEREGR